MKKTILIAFATVICAGGAIAQNAQQGSGTNKSNVGNANQKGAQNTGSGSTKGKDIHGDEKDSKGANAGGNKGKDMHNDAKDANVKHSTANTQGTNQTAHQKHATSSTAEGSAPNGKHHTITPATQSTNAGQKNPKQ